jgi:hypothetical protein
MVYTIQTINGYALLDVASILQKSIRRGDARLAGYFALELFHSGYQKYMWKRLLTISAEDCHQMMTTEIWNLKEAFDFVNADKKTKKPKGRIFISKAVISLCSCYKNRDADHLQNLIYDKIIFSDEDVEEFNQQCEKADDEVQKLVEDLEEHVPIPEYAYDVHTKKGRQKGMTKEDFFKDEQEALHPKQKGLFDNLVD